MNEKANKIRDFSMPEGFRLAACTAAIAKGDRPDLLLVVADEACPAEVTFTQNQIVASPVAMSREHLRLSGGMVRAILVNAGCANACTGARGDGDTMQCAELVARQLECPVHEVLTFSTGVIGQRLPMDNIKAAVPKLFESLNASSESVELAARAIMTTDTRSKIREESISLARGEDARILGFAKGAGMIHPDMATMLAFLFTDHMPQIALSLALRASVQQSYNRISVDGDSSTNDAVLLWTSARKEEKEKIEAGFMQTLDLVNRELAKEIARDGEGASKLIEVQVRGAFSTGDAVSCAKAVVTSLLVKTAVHGEDPNFGRILAAAGRSGAKMDTAKLRMGIGETCLFEEDCPFPERKAKAKEELRGAEVLLWLELAAGDAEAVAWGCDLSAEYVSINAKCRS